MSGARAAQLEVEGKNLNVLPEGTLCYEGVASRRDSIRTAPDEVAPRRFSDEEWGETLQALPERVVRRFAALPALMMKRMGMRMGMRRMGGRERYCSRSGAFTERGSDECLSMVTLANVSLWSLSPTF